jgi:hypothetical protein
MSADNSNNQSYLQDGVSSRLVHYAERISAVKELLQAEERVGPALQSEVGDQGGRVSSVKQHAEYKAQPEYQPRGRTLRGPLTPLMDTIN